jgi:hypothetical protein
MLRWKLVIWQWGVISAGVSIIDVETWVVMSITETLASTLGIAPLFFGALIEYLLFNRHRVCPHCWCYDHRSL